MADKKEEFDLVAVGDHISKFIESFWKPILGVLVVSVAVWGGVVAKNSMASDEEKKAFDELFEITNTYAKRASLIF